MINKQIKEDTESSYLGNIREIPKEEFIKYDKGWNARCHNQPYSSKESLDWREGWNDCENSNPEERIFI